MNTSIQCFYDTYCIERELPPSLQLPYTICSFEPIAQLFNDCQYFRNNRQEIVLLVHPSAEELSETNMRWLALRGFVRQPALVHGAACSFVFVAATESVVVSLLERMKYVSYVGYNRALLHMGLRHYVGKMLHVSTGSGKTFVCDESRGWFRVVDTDEMALEEIRTQYPNFRLKDVSAAENIMKFCRNMMRRDVKRVMRAVRERCVHDIGEGCIVLNSIVSLMSLADFVLLQRNRALVKEGYEMQIEVKAAARLGKRVTLIDRYLSLVLSCDLSDV